MTFRRQKAEHDMTRSEATLIESVRDKEATMGEVRLTFPIVTSKEEYVVQGASNPSGSWYGHSLASRILSGCDVV